MTALAVHRGSAADLVAIAAVDPQVFEGSQRSKSLRDLAEHDRGFVLVALLAEADGVAGYVAVERGAFFGRDFVELLVVGEEWRRSGVGADLLRKAVENCSSDDVFTSTNESNEPMRALLDTTGWSLSGVLDGLDPGDRECVYYRRREPGQPASHRSGV